MKSDQAMLGDKGRQLRLCLVSNFNTFYRNGVFEHVAHRLKTQFLFYSNGSESYWLPEHGVWRGDIEHVYLKGFDIAGTRITPSLPWHLLKAPYDVYLKCINGRFALPVTYLVARLRGRPFVLWTEVWMRYRTRAHRLVYPLTRHIYRHADAVVACGEHVAAFLREEGVDPERIFVARHAVDNAVYARPVNELEVAALRSRLDIAPEQKVVLYMGRMTEVKGLPYLLRAFSMAKRNDAVLVLAGSGSEEATLRVEAAALGIADRVRFAGYVSAEQTVSYYALAWTMVLPSIELDHIKETWGLVVNEAFNQGVPVIASDSVGAAAGGLVDDGVTGYVVPERDAGALAHAMTALLDDLGLRQRMSATCRAVITRWTQEGMAESFLAAVHHAHLHFSKTVPFRLRPPRVLGGKHL
ncbi:glycosyltransferase family 4 protein [Geminicoccus roseus]|uniref:glycosyltransferase family 4 protein n=1 Tax=Geminicoccus roseus TaxID=404900 RepID=UPI00042A13C2|nr:glycosyltransferase family 4 protein [Geminicoccus roseus]